MKPSLLWTCLLALFTSLVSSTALTYKLAAHEKACFFTGVEQKGAKIAFYFAVRQRAELMQSSRSKGPELMRGKHTGPIGRLV